MKSLSKGQSKEKLREKSKDRKKTQSTGKNLGKEKSPQNIKKQDKLYKLEKFSKSNKSIKSDIEGKQSKLKSDISEKNLSSRDKDLEKKVKKLEKEMNSHENMMKTILNEISQDKINFNTMKSDGQFSNESKLDLSKQKTKKRIINLNQHIETKNSEEESDSERINNHRAPNYSSKNIPTKPIDLSEIQEISVLNQRIKDLETILQSQNGIFQEKEKNYLKEIQIIKQELQNLEKLCVKMEDQEDIIKSQQDMIKRQRIEIQDLTNEYEQKLTGQRETFQNQRNGWSRIHQEMLSEIKNLKKDMYIFMDDKENIDQNISQNKKLLNNKLSYNQFKQQQDTQRFMKNVYDQKQIYKQNQNRSFQKRPLQKKISINEEYPTESSIEQ